MSRETIIIIVFAALVILAANILIGRLRTLEEQISSIKELAKISNDSAAKQMEAFEGTIKILNHMCDDIVGVKAKIDPVVNILGIVNDELGSVGRILDSINNELSKLDDVDYYVKMMDDTVISTIRDEYKILEEIKERFLTLEKEKTIYDYLGPTVVSEETSEREEAKTN